MYTLCCTRVLLDKLRHPIPSGEGGEPAPTTALGDWYADRLNIGRNRLILCANERTLLSVVVPARDLPGLPGRLVTSLGRLLRRIGVPPAVIWAELQAMQEVRFGPTRSRSVLGVMNEAAWQARGHIEDGGLALDLAEVDFRLSQVPWSPLHRRGGFPDLVARGLLEE